MTESLNVGYDYRVRDLDDKNYVVERRLVNQKGEEVWSVRGYCSSGKSAAEVLLRALTADRIAKVREDIRDTYSDHYEVNKVRALPPKNARAA